MIMAPTSKQGESLMKNIFRFGLFAAAALSIFACSKVDEAQIPEEGYTHTTTIKVKKSITKTVINEGGVNASFKWSSDDASRFYLKENEVEGTGIAIASSDEYSTITITATFATVSAAEYTYSGFLSKYKTGSNPRVPATQTCTSSSYDPDADILVAKSLSFATTQDNLEMQFARPVVINKMTLKGLTEGETVSKVTISADKNFMGYYDPSTNTWTTDSDELVVNTSQVVPASGQVVIWFVTAPVDAATLTVVAETGGYTYSKTFGSTISFVQNQVTRFGVNSLTKEADYRGDYIIGSYASSQWKLMTSTNGGSYFSSQATNVGTVFASLSYTEFQSEVDTDDYIWTVGRDAHGYYIQNRKTAKYLALTDDINASYAVNALDGTNLTTYFDITVSSGIATITSLAYPARALKYNAGSPRFAFYTSAQTSVSLIPAIYDGRTVVTLSFAEAALDYDTDDYNTCTGQVASASPNVAAITEHIAYALTGDAIGTVNASTGTVTLDGTTGTATITASFAGDEDYRPTMKSYTITVIGAGASSTTVTWNASSGALGSAIGTVGGTAVGTIYTAAIGGTPNYSWSYTRTLVSLASGKSDYVAFSSPNLQLGSGNALESLVLSTSNIPGIIKSVSVVLRGDKHKVSATVNGTPYISETNMTDGYATYTNAVEGTSSGEIVISVLPQGTTKKAFYIQSITVVYLY